MQKDKERAELFMGFFGEKFFARQNTNHIHDWT
jgi:hypothetical protein